MDFCGNAKRKLAAFWRDESGQSLMLAAISMFAIIIIILTIVGVGEATNIQMKLQNAADSAALSGAQVEADCLAQICWINEGMEQIYYQAMRYSVDNATYGVLAELKDFEPKWNPQLVTTTGSVALGSPAPSDSIVGMSGAVGKWQESYDLASVEITRAEEWLRRLSQIQRGIAAIAPSLVEHQVFYNVQSNAFVNGSGGEDNEVRTCYYPGMKLLPDNRETRIALDITKTGPWPVDENAWEPNGWNVVSTTHDYQMTFEHLDHMPKSGGGTTYDKWYMETINNGVTTSIEMESTYTIAGQAQPAYHDFTYTDGDGNTDSRKVYVDANGNVTIVGDGTNQIEKNGDEFTLTSTNGESVTMRWSNGTLQYKSGGSWSNVSDSSSTTVDGVEIPIQFNSIIPLDNNVSVDMHDPLSIYLLNLHVVFSDPVRIAYHTPAGWMYMQDNVARINTLRTDNADGIWKDWPYRYHSSYYSAQSQYDRIRHRMSEVGEKEWEYEFVRVGTYLKDMDMRKFAAHGIMQHDPYYLATAGSEADYWMPPSSNVLEDERGENDDENWEQNREGRWTRYPEWARPPREPEVVDDREFGGWFNIELGRPRDRFALSQTRDCWYCGNKGSVSGPLVNHRQGYWTVEDEDGNTSTVTGCCVDPEMDYEWNQQFDGIPLPRPCGFWYEGPWVGVNAHAERDAFIAQLNAAGAVAWQDYVTFQTGAQLWVQVFCPCECKHEFSHTPKKYADDPKATTTRVRRYLYHACGRFDIASRQSDPEARRIDSGYDRTNPAATNHLRDFFSVKYFPDDVNFWQPALDVTEEVFRRGITVATWAPAAEEKFFEKVGENTSETERNAGIFNPLEGSRNGHFALSSARVFTVVQYMDGTDPQWLDQFSWENNSDYAFPEEEPLDELDRQKNWRRLLWVRSALNGFEPAWRAALVPLNRAVHINEEYSADDVVASGFNDNNTALLMRLIDPGDGRWRAGVVDSGYGMRMTDIRPREDWRHMYAPPMQGVGSSTVNWDDPDIEGVVKH